MQELEVQWLEMNAKMAQINTVASTGSSYYSMMKNLKERIMPKIPTFKAEGSIEQLSGTTSNIQMGLNNTLASALAPVTKAVVDFKVKENNLQNQAEALRLENDFITDMQMFRKQLKLIQNML